MRIIKWTFLILLAIILGYVAYIYISDPWAERLLNNDESAMFYRPSKEMEDMSDMKYSEQILTVEDSIKIHYYTFEPKFENKANIFLIRGNSGNVSTFKNSIETLTDNGFKVYTTDWRGYGKSNGIPNYGGIMKDSEIAFKNFLKMTDKDSLKTIVYGMSLGGQPAVKITKDNQKEIDLLVLDGSLESAHSFITDNFNGTILQPLIKKPEKYNQEYVAIKDIAKIKNIPKLIIHSKIDRAVPIERGRNLFKAAKEPKEFWETDTEHIQTLNEMPEELIEKIERKIR